MCCRASFCARAPIRSCNARPLRHVSGAAHIQGAGVINVALDRERGFELDADRLLAAWRPYVKAGVSVFANNPTGNSFALDAMERVCSALEGKAVVVIDEPTSSVGARERHRVARPVSHRCHTADLVEGARARRRTDRSADRPAGADRIGRGASSRPTLSRSRPSRPRSQRSLRPRLPPRRTGCAHCSLSASTCASASTAFRP